MAKRPVERHIFFPWEKRGGILRRIRVDQAGPVVVALGVIVVVALMGMHERRNTGIRRTRATILNVREVVDSYMADHDGGCPKSGLAGTGRYDSAEAVPRDAWGRTLRLTCPGADHARYDLFSDGPDGKPGGLDRIE
jgi:type II secretion system (T2SS) protein G